MLYDVGYSVLVYDLCGYGYFVVGVDNIIGVGVIEWCDVIGFVCYVKECFLNVKVVLYS